MSYTQSKINELASLMYSPIITPANLLQNIKLDNYVGINYHKDLNNCIIADITFEMYSEQITFRYLFDLEDHLQQIIQLDENNELIYFDRNIETQQIISELQLSEHENVC